MPITNVQITNVDRSHQIAIGIKEGGGGGGGGGRGVGGSVGGGGGYMHTIILINNPSL